MILLLTSSYTFSADELVDIYGKMDVPVFRLNTDRYWEYQFCLEDGEFEISEPATGKRVVSSAVSQMALYKAQLPQGEPFNREKPLAEEKWVRSTLNLVVLNLVRWAVGRGCLKLWTPYEFLYPKCHQMAVAQKYFDVPSYRIHWGFIPKSDRKIVKTLSGVPLENNGYLYSKLVDVSTLSPEYPWFTQTEARGTRDATVLYINGRVHCYQFATERGQRKDWRQLQGTAENSWVPWMGGGEFEEQIRKYMADMELKFGRLDFLIGDGAPEFLEVNPCGQFGWLDDESRSLHREIAEAILEESSTIIR